jgi:hypothetical protein
MVRLPLFFSLSCTYIIQEGWVAHQAQAVSGLTCGVSSGSYTSVNSLGMDTGLFGAGFLLRDEVNVPKPNRSHSSFRLQSIDVTHPRHSHTMDACLTQQIPNSADHKYRFLTPGGEVPDTSPHDHGFYTLQSGMLDTEPWGVALPLQQQSVSTTGPYKHNYSQQADEPHIFLYDNARRHPAQNTSHEGHSYPSGATPTATHNPFGAQYDSIPCGQSQHSAVGSHLLTGSHLFNVPHPFNALHPLIGSHPQLVTSINTFQPARFDADIALYTNPVFGLMPNPSYRNSQDLRQNIPRRAGL